jgi:phenylacetate-CoA ligase
MPEIADFRGALSTVDDRDVLTLSIEVRRGVEPGPAAARLAEATRGRFAVRPAVEVLPLGTLAREFEASVKAPRFVDRRA